jgi:glutamate-1-semialdehyde 2,1-aminomutase
MEAVTKQLSWGTSTIAPSPKNIALADRIRKHMPHMEMIRFVHTGSEAVHMSMRVARAFTGRQKIGKFEGNFHGGYDNLLISGTSFGGPEERPLSLPEGAGIPQSVLDDTVVLPFNNTDATVALIEEHASELAGVVVEAVGGTWMAGIVAEQGFLEALREVTARHGILLIFDEVITGFRVSLGGSTAVTGVTPDLVALAKTIGGGFPMGAFGGRRDVMEQAVTPPRDADDDRVTIFQSGTFQTNLVSLTAGLAMLGELEKPGVYEKLEETGEQVRKGIEKIGANLGLPVQATGQGPIFGIYFADEPVRTIRDVLGSDREMAGTFYLGLVAHGIYITPYHLGFTNASQSEAEVEGVLEVCQTVLETITES